MSRVIGIAVVLVAAIALAGSAPASTGSSRDRALLTTILAGMKTDLVSVQIRDLPREWRSRARYGKKLLQVTSNATTPAGKVRDQWYATLIATAYNDQCDRKADHCLAVYEETGIGGGAIGRSGAHRPFGSRRSLSRTIRARFAAHGLRVSSISFEHPDALAPAVTVRSRHPQRAVNSLSRSDPFVRLDVAGFFLRMVDGHGRLFDVEGASGHESSGWVRPGLQLRNVP
ncbi:MAG TPA: hypothetical protein VKB43_06745 [Gaiellaceae bacterium]|nr:hypothetical protein [Gaiellaceae bacterium]